jgi:hypothetical protein
MLDIQCRLEWTRSHLEVLWDVVKLGFRVVQCHSVFQFFYKVVVFVCCVFEVDNSCVSEMSKIERILGLENVAITLRKSIIVALT